MRDNIQIKKKLTMHIMDNSQNLQLCDKNKENIINTKITFIILKKTI